MGQMSCLVTVLSGADGVPSQSLVEEKMILIKRQENIPRSVSLYEVLEIKLQIA